MEQERLILNAYYESLHDILLERRGRVIDAIKKILPAELAKFGPYTSEDFDAYFEAALAFLDERLEMYNPFGFQYTFGNLYSELALKLELQLSWFDSSKEFEILQSAVDDIIKLGFDEKNLNDYARSLISRLGAFPDKSIIDTYRLKPAVNHLPDFLLASAIEQTLHLQD